MQFSKRLEALRGLAALMVAFCHSLGAVKLLTAEDQFTNSILCSIGNGALAVTLFFVLSGHVLSLSLLTKQVDSIQYWPNFTLRRILRIYPAMLISIVFCFIYLLFIYQPISFDAASKGYYEVWHRGAPTFEFLKNALLLDNYVNPVTWTLEVEVLASLILPFLMYLKNKSPRFFAFLLFIWVCFFEFNPLYIYFRSGFIFMFMFGMYVGEVSAFLKEKFSNQRLFEIAILCLVISSNTHFIFSDTLPEGWLIMSLFSTLFIASVAAISYQFEIFILDLKVTNFLGKISYSFYLWHFPFLYTVGTTVFHNVDNQILLTHPIITDCLLFIVSSILTIPIATISYYLIESQTKSIYKPANLSLK